MALDQRSNSILFHLVKADGYVPIKELTEKYNISRRTVYYDIEKINQWLKEHKLPPVSYIRSAGFHLEREAAMRVSELLGEIKAWQYEFSPEERKALMAIFLLAREAPMFLADLMELTRVSRNTALEDIKGLRADLARFDLELISGRKSGYVIKGNEDDKRKAIVYFLQHVISDHNIRTILAQIPLVIHPHGGETDLFDSEKMKEVHKILAETEQKLNVAFTDDFMNNLTLRLLLFGRRLSQGKGVEVDPVEKEVLKESREYEAAQQMSRKLSKVFQVSFPEDEVFYIAKHLLTSRVQFSEGAGESITPLLEKAVETMVADFQKYACVFFDNLPEIRKNLLIHVKPAFYRVKYGLQDQSGAAQMIKERYEDVFQLTKKIVPPLEAAAGNVLNDNEIALIAAHFGGWMRRAGAKPPERKTALLVCTKGIGTSKLLQHQLEGLFSTVDIIGSVSFREYEQNAIEADVIISTIPLKKSEKPVLVVSPILSDAEKESLLKKVNSLFGTSGKARRSSAEELMALIGRYADIHNADALERELKQFLAGSAPELVKKEKPSLGELLPVENIVLGEEAEDWHAAIKMAAAPLLKNGNIDERYIKAMIQSLIKMGPYVVIAPKVAIPHASPEDGVNKLGMSLLKLNKSVQFSEKGTHPVNLIIILAAIDGESHLKALSELTMALGDHGRIDKLLEARTREEVFKLIIPAAV